MFFLFNRWIVEARYWVLGARKIKNEELKMNVLCPVLRKVGGRKQKRGEIFFAPTS